jgi:3-hydroxyacyl-[acyl-carrier-protein] dehydratase
MTELSANILVPLTHPCYAGHFPGNPILPGVVLLELVAERLGRGSPRAIPGVKFQRALAPGETFTLHWKNGGDRVSFRCESEGEPVAEGSMEFGARA